MEGEGRQHQQAAGTDVEVGHARIISVNLEQDGSNGGEGHIDQCKSESTGGEAANRGHLTHEYPIWQEAKAKE